MPTMPRAAWPLLALLWMAPARADEAITLFNGKDLDGWVAEGVNENTRSGQPRPVWGAEDGMIVCDGQGFGFLRYARREFADFALHVEFRLTPKCNTGVGIRTTVFDPKQSRATRPSFYSYEIQLIDDVGQPPSTHSSGSLYRYVAPSENALRPAGEWNRLDIACVGPHIKVTMNDKTIIDVDQTTIPELKDKPLKGYVCLQNHGGKAAFRNITVRPLIVVAPTSAGR